MTLRTRISDALKQAMKDKDADRLSTLRLINAAIKDRDIAARSADGDDTGVPEEEVLGILGKMAKQRQESARAYEEGGRLDLADREREEITVIEEFLPRQLTEKETREAVDAAVTQMNASSIRGHGQGHGGGGGGGGGGRSRQSTPGGWISAPWARRSRNVWGSDLPCPPCPR